MSQNAALTARTLLVYPVPRRESDQLPGICRNVVVPEAVADMDSTRTARPVLMRLENTPLRTSRTRHLEMKAYTRNQRVPNRKKGP